MKIQPMLRPPAKPGIAWIATAIATAVLIGTAVVVVLRKNTTKQEPTASPAVTLPATTDKSSFATTRSAVSFNLSPELATKPVPTNTWWISALTGELPERLSPLPFVVSFTNAKLNFGVPIESATADYVVAADAPDLSFTPTASTLKTSTVVQYDALRIGLQLTLANGSQLGTLTLSKGSPVQSLDHQQSITLTTTTPTISQLSDGRWVAEVSIDKRRYRVYSTGSMQQQQAVVTIQPGTTVITALPTQDAAPDIEQIFDRVSATEVTSVETSFTANSADSSTTLTWRTRDDQPTAFIVLPHQQTASVNRLGSYWTIRGTAYLATGTSLRVPITRTPIVSSLPIPADDTFFTKTQLESYLKQELLNEPLQLTDSYVAGKELYRLANLFDIATSLSSDTATVYYTRLRNQLTDWLTYTPGENGRYFAYDQSYGGLVAQKPEFGIETFNDHHFQYGYYLYAAAVLGRNDPAFVRDYGQMVDLIAEDIANSDPTNSSFPTYRVTDWYAGHSWASGTARFADGNNQESVSEAINAWYALNQWGSVRQNTTMQQVGQWLYDQEITASRTYWFNTGPAEARFPEAYKHFSASIIWSNKYDWATWFSNEPEAKHGILYLPLSAGAEYLDYGTLLSDDRAALTKELGGKAPTSWKDILLMTQALYDPTGARKQFSATMPVDSSNSIPYLYTWLGWAGQRK